MQFVKQKIIFSVTILKTEKNKESGNGQ